MLRVAVKGLFGHKLRFALTTLAVVLGVSFVAGSLILTDGIKAAFDELFDTAFSGSDVEVTAAEPVSLPNSPNDTGGATLPESTLDRVLAVDGVADAAAYYEGFAQILDDEGEPVGVQGAPSLAFSWAEVGNPLTLESGREPQGPGEVVVDDVSAEAAGLTVGDTARLVLLGGPQEFEIVGTVSFGDGGSLLGATIAAFDVDTAREALGKTTGVDSISVVAEEGVDAVTLAERLDAALGEGAQVQTAEQSAASQQAEVGEFLGFFTTALLAFAGVGLFVGAFIIANTFSIVVAQRSREFALLRALGASARQVRAAVLGEAVVVGVVASAVGLALGIGFAVALEALLDAFGLSLPDTETIVRARTVAASFAIGVGVTVAASLGASRRASRVSPVEAMRGTSEEAPRGLRRRSLLGAVVAALGAAVLLAGLLGAPGNPLVLTALGAAVTFIGVAMLAPLLAGPVVRALGRAPARFGVAGRLAVRNALRNRRRTAATASALMIGLALVSFVTILAASLTASVTGLVADQFAADFILNSGGAQFGALPPTVSESLREDDDIDAVSPLRGSAFVDDQDTQRSISGVHPGDIRELVDLGDVEGDLDGLAGAQVGVTFERAEELGLEIGDTLTVAFPAAPDETLEVAALYETPDLVGAHFLADAEQVAAWSGPLLDVAVFATAAGDRDAARSAIEDAVAGYPNVTVQDQAEFREEQERSIDQLLGLLTALLLLAVIIALLGIANTLALSIFERTREIGLLRAVGMVRRQTRRMVMWESVLTALFGAALGVTVGAFFGWAVTTALARAEGLEEFVIPAGQLLVYAVIAGVAGVVAAVLPAWRAARLDVLEAVTAE